ATRSSWLQPRDMCDAFHDRIWSLSFGPLRSMWPSMALPYWLVVYLFHVRFILVSKARPSAVEPVMASCQFGVMPKPEILAPRSVSAVSWVSLLLGPWRSSTFCAMTSPLKFCQGPLPIRSRALITLTAPLGVELRYARHTFRPA